MFSIVVDVSENQVLDGISNALTPVAKLNFPKEGVAAAEKDRGCTGDEELDDDGLICDEYECQGGTSGRCSIAPNKNCPCYPPGAPGFDSQDDQAKWIEYQQYWLGKNTSKLDE